MSTPVSRITRPATHAPRRRKRTKLDVDAFQVVGKPGVSRMVRQRGLEQVRGRSPLRDKPPDRCTIAGDDDGLPMLNRIEDAREAPRRLCGSDRNHDSILSDLIRVGVSVSSTVAWDRLPGGAAPSRPGRLGYAPALTQRRQGWPPDRPGPASGLRRRGRPGCPDRRGPAAGCGARRGAARFHLDPVRWYGRPEPAPCRGENWAHSSAWPRSGRPGARAGQPPPAPG